MISPHRPKAEFNTNRLGDYTQEPWWRRIRLHLPGVDVLSLFCLSLVFIHVWIETSGGVIAHEILYTQQLGLSTEGLSKGKLWQLISHVLIHGSWLHLAMNLFIIWVMGGRLMVIIGQKKLLITMVLTSLAGGVIFVMFDFFSGISRPLVGASGIGFGLFTLLAMLDPSARAKLIPISAGTMVAGVMLGSLVLCLIHPEMRISVIQSGGLWLERNGFADVFRVAHGCHLGGGLMGIYFSRHVMGKMVTLEELQKQRID